MADFSQPSPAIADSGLTPERIARLREPKCDGLCIDSADIGVPGYGVAYPHPGCPLHAPGEVCECGQPDRCLSPTHGGLSMAEARKLRHPQRPASPSTPEIGT